MKITFTDAHKAEIIGFLVEQGGKLPAAASDLDAESGGLLTEAMSAGRGQMCVGRSTAGPPARQPSTVDDRFGHMPKPGLPI